MIPILKIQPNWEFIEMLLGVVGCNQSLIRWCKTRVLHPYPYHIRIFFFLMFIKTNLLLFY